MFSDVVHSSGTHTHTLSMENDTLVTHGTRDTHTHTNSAILSIHFIWASLLLFYFNKILPFFRSVCFGNFKNTKTSLIRAGLTIFHVVFTHKNKKKFWKHNRGKLVLRSNYKTRLEMLGKWNEGGWLLNQLG